MGQSISSLMIWFSTTTKVPAVGQSLYYASDGRGRVGFPKPALPDEPEYQRFHAKFLPAWYAQYSTHCVSLVCHILTHGSSCTITLVWTLPTINEIHEFSSITESLLTHGGSVMNNCLQDDTYADSTWGPAPCAPRHWTTTYIYVKFTVDVSAIPYTPKGLFAIIYMPLTPPPAHSLFIHK